MRPFRPNRSFKALRTVGGRLSASGGDRFVLRRARLFRGRVAFSFLSVLDEFLFLYLAQAGIVLGADVALGIRLFFFGGMGGQGEHEK